MYFTYRLLKEARLALRLLRSLGSCSAASPPLAMPENVDCTSYIRLLKRPDIWLGFLIIWRPTISTFPTAAAWPAALAPPIAALRYAGFARVIILAPWLAAHSFRAILSN